MRNFHPAAWADERGTTAIEFAIVAPVFILLVIGFIYACLALFTVGSMHFAVEEGARCRSVRTTICSDEATTIAYAKSRYFGPSSAPSFSYATAACGNSVSASANYVMHLGLTQLTVPIRATACFP